MKLTKEHIGKKIGHRAWAKTSWIKPDYVDVLGVAGVSNLGNHLFIVYDNFHDPYDAFFDWVKPKKEWFDFSKFECNETHVRDLVIALDKRYRRK